MTEGQAQDKQTPDLKEARPLYADPLNVRNRVSRYPVASRRLFFFANFIQAAAFWDRRTTSSPLPSLV